MNKDLYLIALKEIRDLKETIRKRNLLIKQLREKATKESNYIAEWLKEMINKNQIQIGSCPMCVINFINRNAK